MYNPDNYLPSGGDSFCLLANYFLFFCSDLAVLIFPTLLIDFKRPNWKSAQGPRGGVNQLFNPSPLYCFTLIFIPKDRVNRWID